MKYFDLGVQIEWFWMVSLALFLPLPVGVVFPLVSISWEVVHSPSNLIYLLLAVVVRKAWICEEMVL